MSLDLDVDNLHLNWAF